MDDQQKFTEFSELMREAPDSTTISHPTIENQDWLGRMSVFIADHDKRRGREFDNLVKKFYMANGALKGQAVPELFFLLSKTRSELSKALPHPSGTVVETGQIFRYFNKVKDIIEEATNDLLVVDPYLDADFVTRYLPFVKPSVTVRLLTANKQNRLDRITPALSMFESEYKNSVNLRAARVHDRYIFIDNGICYQSGASFLDGAKNTASAIIQVLDGFEELKAHYDKEWYNAVIKI